MFLDTIESLKKLQEDFLLIEEKGEPGIYEVFMDTNWLPLVSNFVALESSIVFMEAKKEIIRKRNLFGKEKFVENETHYHKLKVYAEKDENGFHELVTGMPITVYKDGEHFWADYIYCYGIKKLDEVKKTCNSDKPILKYEELLATLKYVFEEKGERYYTELIEKSNDVRTKCKEIYDSIKKSDDQNSDKEKTKSILSFLH